MRNWIRVRSLLALLLLVIGSSPAWACTCAPVSKEELADPEFRLSRIRITESPGWVERKLSDIEDFFSNDRVKLRYEAELVRQISGEAPGDTFEILHWPGSTCSFDTIHVGSEWIVIYYGIRTEIEINTCNATEAEYWDKDPMSNTGRKNPDTENVEERPKGE